MTIQNKADETKTKMYKGKRVNGKPVVTVSAGEKKMRLEPIFHVDSPSRKFNWGHKCFGSVRLAMAILADFFGDDKKAMYLYDDFELKIIRKLARDKSWILTGEDIEKVQLVDITEELIKNAAILEMRVKQSPLFNNKERKVSCFGYIEIR